MKVAALQMNSGEVMDENLTAADRLIYQAVESGAELVVLPENFGFLGKEQDKLAFAQEVEGGVFLKPLRALAKECGVWIQAGTIPTLNTIAPPKKVKYCPPKSIAGTLGKWKLSPSRLKTMAGTAKPIQVHLLR